MNYKYALSLVNNKYVYFLSDIEELLILSKLIMKNNFVIIENEFINTNKIVSIVKVSEKCLFADRCKEYLQIEM